MTIRELCNNEPKCGNCSFRFFCPTYGVSTHGVSTISYRYPGNFNDEKNNAITKAIIETSRRLLEELE